MNDFEARSCHEAMLKYLRRTGEDKIRATKAQGDEEFAAQKQSYVQEEQERIANDLRTRLAQDEIKLKIQRSTNENNARIQKMKTVNSFIEKIYKDAKDKMVARQQADKAQYRDFLKALIVQGLIKLMEAEVHIRCRKSDLALVNEVFQKAGEEYKALMKKEVKLFKDRDVPLKLVVESDRFLAEYSDVEGADSCMGGIVLHARKGRIVCANTIDERLQLVYQEAIPEIRRTLFPSFAKKAPEEAPVAHVKAKHH